VDRGWPGVYTDRELERQPIEGEGEMDNVTLLANIVVGVVSGLLTTLLLGVFSMARQALANRGTKAAPSEQSHEAVAENVSGTIFSSYFPRLLGIIAVIAGVVAVALTVLQMLGVPIPFPHLFGT
jgi:hypothetical protein